MPIFKRIKKSKSAPKLVLIGSFGAGNIGDELILSGFLKKLELETSSSKKRKSAVAKSEGGLKGRIPKSKITVLGGSTAEIKRWHGVKALPLLPCGFRSLFTKNWVKSIKAIKDSDAVIFPGGGLFSDAESPLAVLLWGVHILVAKYFWKPVYLVGQSVGSFKKDFFKKFAKRCLEKAEWIGVRDSKSMTELKKLGIEKTKIKQGEDSALWLTNKKPEIKKPKKKGVLKIFVSVRNFPNVTEKFLREFSKSLQLFAEKRQVRISFASLGKGDEKIWKKICQNNKDSKSWKILKLPKNSAEILKALKKFDLTIGMRLHSLISSYLAGVPTIGISYSPKVAEFQKSIGRTKQTLPVEKFKAEKLLGILN